VHLPRITKILLFALTGAYVLQLLFPDEAMMFLALWPWGQHDLGTNSDGSLFTVGFYPWQLLSYAFLHGSFIHLFLNALALFQFGAVLEQTWGARKYVHYLLVCTVGAGLIQLLLVSSGVLGESVYPTVGASGGIFGLLLAYGMLFPNQRMMLIIPPIPMKARTFVIIFAVISLVMGVTGTQAGIAHFAHLGGMLFGWLMIRYWRGQPPFNKPRGPRLVR
jgi:membrane associated rhomboid family serine protease